MPSKSVTASSRRRRGVIFVSNSGRQSANSAGNETGLNHKRTRELDDDYQTNFPSRMHGLNPVMASESSPSVPALFSSWPPIRDSRQTESSIVQDETIRECLPLLAKTNSLDRWRHVAFIRHSLAGRLPSGFVAMDASRPWMVYWALTGLFLLGEDISEYRERYSH
jgi:hypothetical protein